MNFYLQLHISQKENLAAIRHYEHLKMAIDDDSVWIKNLTEEQVESKTIKILTQKAVYYEKDGKLYLQNSLLPQRNVPSLLWTDIKRAIPINLPSVFENNFDIQSVNVVQPKLIVSEEEREAKAMLVSVSELENYIKTAPAVRLKNLKWVILENEFDSSQTKAFILGTPLLPILSSTIKTFWQKDNLFIPTGYDFQFPMLQESISERLKNTAYSSWYENTIIKTEGNKFNQIFDDEADFLEDRFYSVWNEENQFFLIPKSDFMPLSRSSFRMSFR
ncbi:hypothetical protein [Bernardetia sp.]|uniref:hypothetical protein n=1 Tax=Bernardetia sp. TaxID=1937974 RepID=UPI0025C1BA70|nr:hypothetical protein [Bernardetia sp.]